MKGLRKNDVKKAIFDNLPAVGWYPDIWCKGYALNYALFVWLAMNGGLKTAEVFVNRGLGSHMTCKLFNDEIESTPHLFFRCSFSLNLLKRCHSSGQFFLLPPSLEQVLIVECSHTVLKRLSSLIIYVLVYEIWRERNARYFGSNVRQIPVVMGKIKARVAANFFAGKLKILGRAVYNLSLMTGGTFDYCWCCLRFVGYGIWYSDGFCWEETWISAGFCFLLGDIFLDFIQVSLVFGCGLCYWGDFCWFSGLLVLGTFCSRGDDDSPWVTLAQPGFLCWDPGDQIDIYLWMALVF